MQPPPDSASHEESTPLPHNPPGKPISTQPLSRIHAHPSRSQPQSQAQLGCVVCGLTLGCQPLRSSTSPSLDPSSPATKRPHRSPNFPQDNGAYQSSSRCLVYEAMIGQGLQCRSAPALSEAEVAQEPCTRKRSARLAAPGQRHHSLAQAPTSKTPLGKCRPAGFNNSAT